MNNLNLPPVSPEQQSETSKNIAWDNLAKLSQTETWEEHTQKANSLTHKIVFLIDGYCSCVIYSDKTVRHRIRL